MRLNILLFALGVWVLQQRAGLPDMRWVVALLAGGALLLVFCRRGIPRAMLIGLLCVGIGFGWAAARAHWRLADELPMEWEGRDMLISGVVATLPQRDARSVRFEFDVEEMRSPQARVPKRILLSWWGAAARDGRPAAAPLVNAGERWVFTVRLKRPRGLANPHGFDYEAWLLERGIRATGYVRGRAGAQLVTPMVHRPSYWIEAVRERIRNRILHALDDGPYAGVIAALAVGDQRAIPTEQWQVFTRTGVNHLMSISGLHVTMVSGLVFTFVLWGWRRSSGLVLRLPAGRGAAAAGVGAALCYALLAGFAVPAQRTLYMLAVAAAALWTGALQSVSMVLSLALLVVLLLDPWAVLAPGFWLSFGAVAVILYVTVGRVAPVHWLRNWVSVQWAVTLGLVPPLLALFHQVSIVSPFANAVAIPVVSLLVVPLTLLGVVMPVDWLFQAAQQLMSWCGLLLTEISALPAAMWQQHAPPLWAAVVAAVGVAWLLLPRGFPSRWLGGVLMLPLALSATPPLARGELRLTVLDVGHGLAVVARTRGHALLYDTGPAFASGADSGSRIIVPYLRASGVARLAGMIVSHDDIDHTGGAESVMGALPVAWMLTSLPDMDPLPLQTERAYRCFAGQQWEWDGIAFEILHPARASHEVRRIRDNDRSCVLKISSRAGSVLVPADIERGAEAEMIAANGARLQANVLIAPHQGSRTSSTVPFVAAVRPAVVIFPVGYRNRFGHPHREVLDRYRDIGGNNYRTDRDGAITILFDTSGTIRVEPHRAVYRRYWQAQFAGDSPAMPETYRNEK
jgi:competence protein ComEC